MILIIEPFSEADDIRYGCGLIFNGSFLIMVGD